MKKKVTGRTIQGFFAGIAIGQIISVIISLSVGSGDFIVCVPDFVESVGNEAMAAALQTLLCGIMGAGFGAASVIWEMDNLSLAVQTGSCFGIYSAIMFPIAYITNWMEHSLTGVICYIGIFAAIFIIVWLVQYFSVRRKINAINRKLNK